MHAVYINLMIPNRIGLDNCSSVQQLIILPSCWLIPSYRGLPNSFLLWARCSNIWYISLMGEWRPFLTGNVFLQSATSLSGKEWRLSRNHLVFQAVTGGKKRLSNSHTNSSVRPWCSVWREPIWCPDNPKRWMNFIEHLIWCGCSKRPLNSIQRKKIMIGSGPRSFDQLIVLRFHLANLNYVFQFRLLKPANSYSCTCKLLCNPYCLLIHVACQLRW